MNRFDSLYFIGPKDDRPLPDSATTVAVAEGNRGRVFPRPCSGMRGIARQRGCMLEIDTVFGLHGTPEPEPDDFELWRGTRYVNHGDNDRPYWLMTYRPFVDSLENYEVWLELVQYVDGYRHVHASWRGLGRLRGPSPGQKCWVYRNTEPWEIHQIRLRRELRSPLLDSECLQTSLDTGTGIQSLGLHQRLPAPRLKRTSFDSRRLLVVVSTRPGGRSGGGCSTAGTNGIPRARLSPIPASSPIDEPRVASIKVHAQNSLGRPDTVRRRRRRG